MNKVNTVLVLLCLTGLVSSPAGASTWDAGSGNWSTGANWIGGEPLAGTTTYVNNTGTATITNAGEVSNYLHVGSSVGGAVQMNSGDLNIGLHEYIGRAGAGSFTQNDGTHTITYQLYLGGSPTAGSGTGTYTLKNGLLDVNYHLNVGYSGTGYFYHSGGTNDVDDDLNIGVGSTSTGTYQLSGTGQLSAYNQYIGRSGAGIFTQSVGTTNTLGGTLTLGYYEGNGSYTLNGAQLTAYSETIGGYGTGTFTQIGGTNTISSRIDIGANDGGDGTYTIKGGTITDGTSYGRLSVRDDWRPATKGTFQGWGTVDVWTLNNNGRVIANGYGAERTLDMSAVNSGSVYNLVNNTTTNGWFAVDKGRLELPAVSVAAGNTTVNWGEGSSDTTIDLVNSVRMAFTGATAGDVSVSLLSGDRSDAPLPGGWNVMAVWDFQPAGGFSFDEVDLTFRYDDVMAGVLGLDESSLSLFHYEGGEWVDVVTSIDTVNKRIQADGVSSFSSFAVGTVPEPCSLGLLALGGLAVLKRRRR